MIKIKHLSFLVLALIVADQALKFWVKTHMHLDESIVLIPDWMQLKFVENNGAAFGMQISSNSGFDWGKLCLSLFRVGLIGALAWYIFHLVKSKKGTKGVLIGLSLILAGAIGNLIDSAFYGMIFSASSAHTTASIGGSYAPFMFGRVVDMFYFPLFKWDSCPSFLKFLLDYDNYFFGAIFNLADAYISVAVVYLLIFQQKFAKEL